MYNDTARRHSPYPAFIIRIGSVLGSELILDKRKIGKLTVNVGGMFSGKSSELLRQERRYTLANKVVFSVKPKIDDRYSTQGIVTHDMHELSSEAVHSSEELKSQIYKQNSRPDVVLIDEIQFFDNGILAVINQLIVDGIDVVAAGLDMDRFGKPFGVTPYLMAVADHVQKLHAACADCGEDAWISYGMFVADEEIVIGEREKYLPLCRECYMKRNTDNLNQT